MWPPVREPSDPKSSLDIDGVPRRQRFPCPSTPAVFQWPTTVVGCGTHQGGEACQKWAGRVFGVFRVTHMSLYAYKHLHTPAWICFRIHIRTPSVLLGLERHFHSRGFSGLVCGPVFGSIFRTQKAEPREQNAL